MPSARRRRVVEPADDDAVDDDDVLTSEEQEARLQAIWNQHIELESHVMWAMGTLAIFVAGMAILGIANQLQFPWSIEHFQSLREQGIIRDADPLLLSLLGWVIIAALNGVVFTPFRSPMLLIFAWIVSGIMLLSWTTAFILAGVLSPWHLWLPLGPVAYTALSAYFDWEARDGREQLTKLAGLKYDHDSA